MTPDKLLTPLQLGPITLPNRVWMAPLTRLRAQQPGDVPGALHATYYAQRASAGLIVSEATQISQQGKGYAQAPGIYTDAQEAGWKQVVDAVHGAGGHIALQLWHVGRVSHRSLQPNGEAPVAPSAIQATSSRSVIHGADGGLDRAPCDMPRALETGEIPGIVADYVAAARRARRAGFDFVEIHSANGYLLNQFLASQTNQRTDAYGGSIENRIRIVLEVVDAVAAEIGAERVGVRLSPHGVMNDMICPETEATTLALMRALDARKIAFVHIAEPDWAGGAPLTDSFRQQLRDAFSGVLVFCGGYTAERAETLIARGIADAVAFGRPYIANPDLVERFRRGAPLNTPNADTFYGGGEAGYTDYPTLSAA